MNNTNLIPTMGWVCVFCVTSLLAQNIALAEEPGLVEFDIEAQALGDALTEFGVQSGKEVYFVSADVAGVQAPRIEGKYSSTDVIEQLLDASGVEYFIDDNGTLLVGTAYAAVAVDERGDSDSKNLKHLSSEKVIQEAARRMPERTFSSEANRAMLSIDDPATRLEFRDRIYAARPPLDAARLGEVLREFGLDTDAFETRMRSATINEALELNYALRHELGISGTPNFVLITQYSVRIMRGWDQALVMELLK